METVRLRSAIYSLTAVKTTLERFLDEEKSLDRHERSAISSKIQEIDNLVQFLEHCVSTGFIDY